MATVTTATSSLNVEVSYVCSVCGTSNKTQTTIQAFGKNPDKASARMQNILTDLNSDDVTKRYTHANLKCKCAKCHYSEPWADLDFYKLDGHIMVWSLVCGLIYLTQGLQPIMKHFEFPRLYPLGSAIMQSMFWLIILLPPVLIFVYKKILAASSARKIAELPAESLPQIQVAKRDTPSVDDILRMVNAKKEGN